jgi:hypothetical protein
MEVTALQSAIGWRLRSAPEKDDASRVSDNDPLAWRPSASRRYRNA